MSVAQKSKLKQLQETLATRGNDQFLQQILIKTKWDVNQAVDYIFTNGITMPAEGGSSSAAGSSSGGYSQQKAKALFDSMKTTNEMGEEVMDQDGIGEFMSQVGIDAETDVAVILISMYMEAKYMGEYTWAEFDKGCSAQRVDSVAGWRNLIPRMRQELQNENVKHQVYKFAFSFAQEKGKRNVEVELANSLWDLLIGASKCSFLPKWQDFLRQKVEKNEILVVTKDTWELFYDLVKQTRGEIANFEDDGCWPALIDDFVAFNAATK